LTPVFTDVDCRLIHPRVTRSYFMGDSGLDFNMDLATGTTCTNSNPYIIGMRSAAPINVYMGKYKTKVATVVDIPATEMKADGGDGVLDVFVNVAPTRTVMSAMYGDRWNGNAALYFELSMALEIDVGFFLTRYKTEKVYDKKCGFDMQIFRNAVSRVGAFVCADSWNELRLPRVDASTGSYDDTLEFFKESLAPEEVDECTKAKDLGLGGAMIVGCLLGIVFAAAALVCFARMLRLCCCPLGETEDGLEGRGQLDGTVTGGDAAPTTEEDASGELDLAEAGQTTHTTVDAMDANGNTLLDTPDTKLSIPEASWVGPSRAQVGGC